MSGVISEASRKDFQGDLTLKPLVVRIIDQGHLIRRLRLHPSRKFTNAEAFTAGPAAFALA